MTEPSKSRPGRPRKIDLHTDFEIWGIWVEAFEHGGFPHQDRTFWVKTAEGDSILVYDSPAVRQPHPAKGTHLVFLAVEKFLFAQGSYARSICYHAYVKNGYWFEDKDRGFFERRTKRLGGWRESALRGIIGQYHRPDSLYDSVGDLRAAKQA